MEKPIKGLHRDFQYINQPENTLRYALNSIGDSFDGGIGSVMSEPGNELCIELENEIIGVIPIADEEFAIFSVGDYSEIGLLKNCNYTSIVKSDCLNFSKNYPIKGVSRVKNCERIIYWNDTFNQDRQFNFDNLDDYLKSEFIITDTSLDKWDCNKFNLIQSFQPLSAVIEENGDTGSSIPEGGYVFAYAYEDSNNSRTDFFSFSDFVFLEENHSVDIHLKNIDTNFSYVRIAMIAFTTGDAVTNTVYLFPSVPISSDIIDYEINYLPSLTTELSDINIESSKFVKSHAMEIVNKRLLRGNLSEEPIDWGRFQELATLANVRWIAKLEKQLLDFTNGEQTVVTQKSLRRDEIYDIGIVVVLKDGRESPQLTIPGRDAITDINLINTGNQNRDIRSVTSGNNFDKSLVTVTAYTGSVAGVDEIHDKDVAHLNLAIGDTVERWEVYNTAIRDSGPISKVDDFFSFGGVMGYYEDPNQLYPETKNSLGNNIYGSLAGNSVRYHRTPTHSLCPVHKEYDNVFINDINNRSFIHHLGIQIENIVFPSEYQDQVLGYRIVYSKLDNPTVIDTGILERVSNLSFTDEVTPSTPFHTTAGSTNTPYLYSFYSPKSSFDSLSRFSYISPQYHLESEIQYVYDDIVPTAPEFGSRRLLAALVGKYTYNGNTDRKLEDKKFIDFNKVTFFDKYSVLNNGKQEVNLLLLEEDPVYNTFGTFNFGAPDLDSTEKVGYSLTVVKRNITPLNNRYATRFVPFDSNIYTSQNQYVFGGDTYLVDFSFRKTQRSIEKEETPQNTFLSLPQESTIIRFWTESSINTNYREEGDGSFTASDGTIQQGEKFWPKSLTIDEFLSREPEYRNYYKLNRDSSIINFWKEYSALSANYEFNENCNDYPNLIAYSEVSEEIDLSDKYRIFRINNLGIIPENRGEITNLVYYRGKLLAFTSQSLFALIPNPQQIETDIASIYLGTAEFLAIPPNEMIESEWGHAGTSGRFNIKKTPYGLFWQDIGQGKIYKFFDGLEDISAQGMHNYFQNNRSFDLHTQYVDQFNTDYPFEDNTLLDSGIGIRSVYDPMYERYILTKIDKKATRSLNDIKYCFSYPEEELEERWFQEPIGTQFPINFSDTSITYIGDYNYNFPLSNIDIPNSLANINYTRTFPFIEFTLETSPTFNLNPVKYLANSVDWDDPNTYLSLQGNTFTANINAEYNTIGYQTGNFSGTRPYQSWPKIVGWRSGGSVTEYIGLHYQNDVLGGLYATNIQIDNDEAFYEIAYRVKDTFYMPPTPEGQLPLKALGIKENITTNPSTNKVVQIESELIGDNLFVTRTTPRAVMANSRRHIIGVVVPEVDDWRISASHAFVTLDGADEPEAYIIVNEVDKYPINIITGSVGFYKQYIIEFDFVLSLNKGDIVDFYINNTSETSEYLFPNSDTKLLLSSTTDTVRTSCDYVSPEKVYELGDYTGFNVSGYPLSINNASAKIPSLLDPLYWLPFNIDTETINVTAGDTVNIASSDGVVSETGLYELYSSDMIISFTSESRGASDYNITLDLDGTTLATFVYDSALSIANGYDTFKGNWTGKTHIELNQGDPWPEINLEATGADFVNAEVTSDYNAYVRMSNALQEIRYDECESFIIRNYDSLTSIVEGALLAFGANYTVNVSGTEERLINYVEIPEDGFYDIYINNIFDISDPGAEFTLYINDVAQTPIFIPNTDGSGFEMQIFDLTLKKNDTIKVTAKNVTVDPSVFFDEFLTTLLKKDYTCVEVLPFEEKSSTLSYDVKNNNWASFHSYTPKLMFNDSKSYYTVKDLTKVYKHVNVNYLTYYEEKFPHIIEFVTATPVTTILNSIYWIGEVQQYNENYWIDIEEVSFDQMLVRNSKQSTGLQNLSFNLSPIEWDNSTKKIVNKNREYRVGGIRNLAEGQPLVTQENTNKSIDIVSNENVINTTKKLYEQDPLRDKYHIIRLYYNPETSDKRIITNLVDTLKQYSFG